MSGDTKFVPKRKTRKRKRPVYEMQLPEEMRENDSVDEEVNENESVVENMSEAQKLKLGEWVDKAKVSKAEIMKFSSDRVTAEVPFPDKNNRFSKTHPCQKPLSDSMDTYNEEDLHDLTLKTLTHKCSTYCLRDNGKDTNGVTKQRCRFSFPKSLQTEDTFNVKIAQYYRDYEVTFDDLSDDKGHWTHAFSTELTEKRNQTNVNH